MSTTVPVQASVNGETREAEVDPRLLLVHWLRDELGLTGTHGSWPAATRCSR